MPFILAFTSIFLSIFTLGVFVMFFNIRKQILEKDKERTKNELIILKKLSDLAEELLSTNKTNNFKN